MITGDRICLLVHGKTNESDRHPNPPSNPNANPYLVAVRCGSLAWYTVAESVSYSISYTAAVYTSTQRCTRPPCP